MGIEPLGSSFPNPYVRSPVGFGRSAAHVARNAHAQSCFGGQGLSDFRFLEGIPKSSSERKIRVGDRWSVALWWSVSYPACGLASIDASYRRNFFLFPA